MFTVFVIGGLSFWLPVYAIDAFEILKVKTDQIPLIFGIVYLIAGVLAFIFGFFISPEYLFTKLFYFIILTKFKFN